MHVYRQHRIRRLTKHDSRWGASSLEWVLVLGASLPMLTVAYYYAVKIIRAVYEMTCGLICWPFM